MVRLGIRRFGCRVPGRAARAWARLHLLRMAIQKDSDNRRLAIQLFAAFVMLQFLVGGLGLAAGFGLKKARPGRCGRAGSRGLRSSWLDFPG
jgi:hypothetical protein